MEAHDTAARAELVQLDPVRVVAPILLGDVIALLALGAGQRNVGTYGFLCHLVNLYPRQGHLIVYRKNGYGPIRAYRPPSPL